MSVFGPDLTSLNVRLKPFAVVEHTIIENDADYEEVIHEANSKKAAIAFYSRHAKRTGRYCRVVWRKLVSQECFMDGPFADRPAVEYGYDEEEVAWR